MGLCAKTRIIRIILPIVLTVLFCSIFVFAQSNFVASVSLNQDGRSCSVLTSDTAIIRQINSTGNCFSFANNNLVLDCAGFLILGNGSGTAINITNRDNITVKNCVLANFSVGLERINASNNIVINVTSINASTQVINSTIDVTNESIVNTTLVAINSKISIIDSSINAFNFTNVNLSVARNNSAIVNFTTPITGASTTNLNSLITLNNASVTVDSSSAGFINTTAHLVFFPQNLTNIEATVDFSSSGNFVSCPSDVCSNQGQSGVIFQYDVSHFTSFSFGPSSSPTPPSPQPSPSPASGPGGPSSKPEKAQAPAPQAPVVEQKGFFSDFSKWAQKIKSSPDDSSPAIEKPGIAEKINNLFYPVYWGLKKVVTLGFSQKDLVLSILFILLILALVSYLSYQKHNLSLIHRFKIWWLMLKQKRKNKKHKKSGRAKQNPQVTMHFHKNNESQIQPYVKSAVVLAPPPVAPSSQPVQVLTPALPPAIPAPANVGQAQNISQRNLQNNSINQKLLQFLRIR